VSRIAAFLQVERDPGIVRFYYDLFPSAASEQYEWYALVLRSYHLKEFKAAFGVIDFIITS
jgi:hypothetical protein